MSAFPLHANDMWATKNGTMYLKVNNASGDLKVMNYLRLVKYSNIVSLVSFRWPWRYLASHFTPTRW